MVLDQQLLFMTTLINAKWQKSTGTASGFFFQMEEPKDTEEAIGNFWLITNRHAIYDEDETTHIYQLADSLTFRVRLEDKNTKQLSWIEITLNQDELLKKVKALPETKIDVVAIDVCEETNKAIDKYPNMDMYISTITPQTLSDKSKFDIEVCDDLMVIGYPRGYYDEKNLYPIVKNGTIASMWGTDFRGHKGFAIDAKLFPGSSGSLVITKPTRETLDENGYLAYKVNKLFYCLGIFSGEPLFDRLVMNDEGKIVKQQFTFDLGFVWYSSVIVDTINTGINITRDYKK